MKRFGWLGLGAAFLIVAGALLYAVGGEPAGTATWHYRRGTIGDFRPIRSATLGESDGPGALVLECTGSALSMRLLAGREPAANPVAPAVLRYRVDQSPAVQERAEYGGQYIWLGGEPTGGDDPMVRRIAGGRWLVIEVVPEGAAAFRMAFDLRQTGEAIAWLRSECAEL